MGVFSFFVFSNHFLGFSDYEGALKLMQKATTLPSRKVAYFDESESVQMRVHKSLKLWSLYADLEEGLGTFKVSTIIRSFVF